MIFQQITTGGDNNLGYYLCDEQAGVAAVIDPSFTPEKFLVIAEEMEVDIQYIINTHSHPDHAGGNAFLLKKTDAHLVGYGVKGRNTIKVDDDDEFELGSNAIKVIHTPGHTKDSICLVTAHHVVTGDSLFVGKIAAADKSKDADKIQFKSLKKLMKSLPDDMELYPGHDFGRSPFSTVRRERDNNPFLNAKTLKEFSYLKKYWASKECPHE